MHNCTTQSPKAYNPSAHSVKLHVLRAFYGTVLRFSPLRAEIVVLCAIVVCFAYSSLRTFRYVRHRTLCIYSCSDLNSTHKTCNFSRLLRHLLLVCLWAHGIVDSLHCEKLLRFIEPSLKRNSYMKNLCILFGLF